MPNRSKQKGDRAERAIVDLLRSYGLDAYRIPLSGAVTGFKSDVEIRTPIGNLKLESKCRSGGFTRIYNWLDGNEAVILKADHKEPLAVIDLGLLARILSAIDPNRIEKLAHKPSHNPPLDSPNHKQSPEPIPIDPNVVLIHDDRVYINKPVARPVGSGSRPEDWVPILPVSRET